MAINFTDSPADGATQVISGRTYTYNSAKNKWDTTATEVVGPTATTYATVNDLPTSGVLTGDQAFVSGTNRLYIWNGTGWYNIALINTNPTISGVSSSYALATDGTATTVTITATDPEGLPITYSIASDTSGNIATVTQNANVFTITPSTNNAYAGTFSLTFRASDGVNVATAVSEFTLQFSVENSNYTTGLITSTGSNGATNGTFVDSSSASKTVTNLNASQTSFSPYRHGGYSTYFNGTTGTKLTTPSQFDFSGAFTAEFWFNVTTGNRIEIGTAKDVTPSDFDYWRLGSNGSGYPFFQCRSDSATVTTATGAALVDDGAWHHIAGVRDASGNMTLYVDGVSAATATNSGNLGTSQIITIGAFDYESTGNDVWGTGYLRDVRMSSNARYLTNFTVSTEFLTADSDTTLLTCHLPYIADGSTNGHSITVYGNTSTQPFTPYDTQEYTVGDHGGSYSLVTRSGQSGPSIDVASDPDFAFGTDPFTIEFWYYPNQAGQQWDQLISTTGNDGIFFANRSGYLDWTNNNDTAALIRSSWPAVGRWSHIVLTQDSTTRAVFINGVRTGTASTAHSWAQGQFRVAYGTGRGNFSNIRIVKGTAVYDPSQTTLTVPTAPLTDITNTKLLLKGENGGIIDKAQVAKEIRLLGNVSSSTTETKYLTSSMYFDGTGDYITSPDNDLYEMGSADFTVELWVYCTGDPGTWQILVGKGASGIYSPFALYRNSDGNGYLFGSTSGTSWAVSNSFGALSTNTWYHLALTRSGNTWTVYKDGVSSYSTTISGSVYNNSTALAIGGRSDNTELFQGYMSDVRITKGLARYTANFTPPTEPLKG